MKKLLLFAILMCLGTLLCAQTYNISMLEITSYKSRLKGEVEKAGVFNNNFTVKLFLAGAYSDGTGAYIEFSRMPRFYIMRRLRSQNPAESHFIIVKDKEFTELTVTSTTIKLKQLNRNPNGYETTYYYQSGPVTKEQLGETDE